MKRTSIKQTLGLVPTTLDDRNPADKPNVHRRDSSETVGIVEIVYTKRENESHPAASGLLISALRASLKDLFKIFNH